MEKKPRHYNTDSIDVDGIGLDELVQDVKEVIKKAKTQMKSEGYKFSNILLEVSGGSSYDSPSLDIIIYRFETDKEVEDRLKQEEKKQKQKEEEERKERELQEDADYIFFKELEAKLKREGKIK